MIQKKDMRYFFLLLCCFSAFHVQAQPQGRLYLHNAARLAYIAYPGATFHTIDSTVYLIADIQVHGGRLFAAYSRSWPSAIELRSFDLQTLTPTDSSRQAYVRRIGFWQGDVVVASSQAPFVRVYDPANLSLPRFTLLDSADLGEAPVDMAIQGDRAFLLLPSRLAVLDLASRSLLGLFITDSAPPPFRQNRWLTFAEDYLYIEREYYTALIRSDLLRVHMDSSEVKLLAHLTGYGSFSRPVRAAKRIYMFHYDSYYDLQGDSLHFSTFMPFSAVAVAFDSSSGAVFVQNNQEVGYYRGSSFEEPFPLSQFVSGAVLFVPSAGTGVSASTSSLQAYPNPTQGTLWLRFPKPPKPTAWRLIAPDGRILKTGRLDAEPLQQVDIGGVPAGCYVLSAAGAQLRVVLH